jgi:hypothetical protein
MSTIFPFLTVHRYRFHPGNLLQSVLKMVNSNLFSSLIFLLLIILRIFLHTPPPFKTASSVCVCSLFDLVWSSPAPVIVVRKCFDLYLVHRRRINRYQKNTCATTLKLHSGFWLRCAHLSFLLINTQKGPFRVQPIAASLLLFS